MEHQRKKPCMEERGKRKCMCGRFISVRCFECPGCKMNWRARDQDRKKEKMEKKKAAGEKQKERNAFKIFNNVELLVSQSLDIH